MIKIPSVIVLTGLLCVLGSSVIRSVAAPDGQKKTEPTAAPAKAVAASTSKPAAAQLDALFPAGQWKPLFDGTSLRGWEITQFAGHGDVVVDEKFRGAPALIFEQGAALTGLTWTNVIPKIDYEVSFEAMKLAGSDFFSALTFPYRDSFCTFINGGWGGAVVGISSVDGSDASQNETTKYMKFEPERWYRIRVKVTAARIEAWIDNEQMVNLETKDKKISMRLGEIEKNEPLGFAGWQTHSALRDIKLRRLPDSETKPR